MGDMEEAIKAAAIARMVYWGYDKSLDPQRFEDRLADVVENDETLPIVLKAALPHLRRTILNEAANFLDKLAALYDDDSATGLAIAVNTLRNLGDRPTHE